MKRWRRLALLVSTLFALWSEEPRFSAFVAFACMVGAGFVVAVVVIDRMLCASGIVRFC